LGGAHAEKHCSYVAVSAGQAELDRETADGLKALIDVALEISSLKEFLGREKPTVITVSLRVREVHRQC
jgi:phosphoglucomutase